MREAAYRPGIARINLHLSDELHAALVAEARRVGLSPPGLARELVARGVGFTEGRREVEDLRRAVADMTRRLDRIERSTTPGQT